MLRKIRGFFLSGERELFNKLRKLIKYSMTALDLLIEMNNREMTDEIDKLILINEEISSLEKRGDEETMSITSYIMKGAVLPGFRSQLINLINILDDILDTIHIISREILRVRRYTSISKTQDILIIHEKIINQLKHSRQMLIELDKLFDCLDKSWDSLIEISASIERMEEGGDALKEDSLDSLYIIKDRLSWFVFDYYKNKIYMIDSIQDRCEDASNTLMSILGQLIS